MAIIIDSAFPGGGVDGVRFQDSRTVEFAAPLDSGQRSLWFCFRVRGAKGQALRFCQRGLERVLGVHESRGYAPVCPVYRSGASDWARVDPRDVSFSADPLAFSFAHRFADDEAYFAFCYPYTRENLAGYLSAHASSRMRLDSPGRSDEGRDVPCLTVGDPADPNVRDLVVVLARQHAGEVTGSFALEGMLDVLLADAPLANRLLGDTLFVFFPLADIDSVEAGRYGKDQYPIDYNRDWSFAPFHAGTRLMQAVIGELTQRYRLTCVIDLHAPQPGAPSYLVPNRQSPPGGEEWLRFWDFALRFEDSCQGLHNFRLADIDPEVLDWGSVYRRSLNSSYFSSRHGAVAFGVELSYHRDNQGRLLTREDWRSLGGLLVGAYARSSMHGGSGHPAVDAGRIPAWTVPENPAGWEHITLPRNLDIRAAEGRLHLSPRGLPNQAWLECPLRPAPSEGGDRRTLRLSSDGDFSAIVQRTYFKDACMLGLGKPEYRFFEKGEHRLSFAGMELAGDSYTVSLKFEGLGAGLQLSLEGDASP
jgi:Zinc carboxypeptidase/Cytosolic carboxypeptidase N-terminal domain